MSSKSSNGASVSGEPLFLLFLVFLVLKLCEVINWSWWWVTAPLWIPLGLAAVLALVALACYGIAAALKPRPGKIRRGMEGPGRLRL
jgi:hypothetical protein